MANRGDARKNLGELSTHVRSEVEAIRKDYARMRREMDDMNELFATEQGLPTGRATDEESEQPRDLAARGARCMENLRKKLFANEDRLIAVENTLLTIMQEHAYVNGGAQPHATDPRRDESWHAPPMDDLAALEAETGVAGQEGPGRMRVTVAFAYKEF